MDQFQGDLEKITGEGTLKRGEPMSRHTTFQIGGPAEFYLDVNTPAVLKKVLDIASRYRVPLFVFGGGSNILVGDQGIKGLTVRFHSEEFVLKGKTLRVAAGMGLAKIAMEMINRGLSTGLENLATVPGTVGGAIYNNSHWQDKLLGDFLLKAEIYTPRQEVKEVPADYFRFAYDYSILRDSGDIVLTALFPVGKGVKEEMLKAVIANNQTRSLSQPLDTKCAGCTFRNPSKEQPAGKLIEQCGLKGKIIGGAKVSQKHANFIINNGNASAFDVLKLIELCRREVRQKFGLDLKEEIFLVGEFAHD